MITYMCEIILLLFLLLALCKAPYAFVNSQLEVFEYNLL